MIRSHSLDISKGLLSAMLRDIGLTLRSLRGSPLFTALTVATLSLCIGARPRSTRSSTGSGAVRIPTTMLLTSE